jgi:hypothetical protein
MNENLIPSARLYAARHQLEIAESPGSGKDGIVFIARRKDRSWQGNCLLAEAAQAKSRQRPGVRLASAALERPTYSSEGFFQKRDAERLQVVHQRLRRVTGKRERGGILYYLVSGESGSRNRPRPEHPRVCKCCYTFVGAATLLQVLLHFCRCYTFGARLLHAAKIRHAQALPRSATLLATPLRLCPTKRNFSASAFHLSVFQRLRPCPPATNCNKLQVTATKIVPGHASASSLPSCISDFSASAVPPPPELRAKLQLLTVLAVIITY